MKKYTKFIDTGYFDFGNIINKKNCNELLKKIRKARPLTKNIFYKSKKEFTKKGRFERYAPGMKAHNLLLEEGFDTDFIDNSKAFKKAVTKIMGPNYKIVQKKIVRSTPARVLPSWLRKEVMWLGRLTLNPWIRDKFQDIMYFLNADYHQDMTSKAKWCTFYIYLDEVNKKDSAIRILENSHKFGVTSYPHNLRNSLPYDQSKKNQNVWFYTNAKGQHMKCQERVMIGKPGKLICFHGLTIHGTYYNFSSKPRVSLRYLILSDSKNFKKSILGRSFKKIALPHSPKNSFIVRHDRNKDGSFKQTGMSVRP